MVDVSDGVVNRSQLSSPSIERLLIDQLLSDRVIAFHPILARVLGGIPEAVFTQQVLHWTKSSDDGWAYRTQVQLEEETTLSVDVQQRVRTSLLGTGILEEKRTRGNKLHYRINRTALLAKMMSLQSGEPVDLPVPPPEELKPKATKAERLGKTHVPDDFTPTPRTIELALTYQGVGTNDIDRELPKFILHHQSQGNRYIDWQKAFLKWMLNFSQWKPRSPISIPREPIPINARQTANQFRVGRSKEATDALQRRAANGDQLAIKELES